MAEFWKRLSFWWSERQRRAMLVGCQTKCEFSGGRCAEIRMGSDKPMRGRNCNDGRAQYLSGHEVEKRRLRFESDVQDGWKKADGTLCDRDLYVEAITKRTTPAALVAAHKLETL